MAQWATFAGITGVVLVLLLALSRLTQTAFSDVGSDRDTPSSDGSGDGDDADRGAGGERVDGSERAGETGRADRTERAAGVDRAESPFYGTPFESAAERSRPSRSPVEDDGMDGDDEGGFRGAGEAGGDAGADDEDESGDVGEVGDGDGTGTDGPFADVTPVRGQESAGGAGRPEAIDPGELSTGVVLANVALSQGLFALVLLGAVVYTNVPPDALGVEFSLAYVESALAVGTAAGIVLYVANEIGAALATRFGFDHDERLRELLAPDSGGGWVILLGGVLPIIAVFEELLFRAALVGVPWAGFGIDPWVLAVGSSVAFALGHGMQGRVGIVVTGALGFVLAALFVVTESLLVVIVAHYWVNALEFVVHEGFDLEWTRAIEG